MPARRAFLSTGGTASITLALVALPNSFSRGRGPVY